MHVLKTGCRGQDCPPEYGPHTTVYNRFDRWSGRGIWQQIFETAAGSPEPPEQVALDSTHVRAHRCAGGGKGGKRSNHDRLVPRAEQEWPLARTQWTKFYLHPDAVTLSPDEPEQTGRLSYEATGETPLFLTAPFTHETEITGPVAARIVLSSSTADADLFLVLGLFDPAGKEVTFHGSNDPGTPVGIGWLRASHRKLDRNRTTPYRPYRTHDEVQPLAPGEPVELDVEIWPTSIVVPAVFGSDLRCAARTIIATAHRSPFLASNTH